MRYLFIGNSHTFRNDMPAIFQAICRANGRDAEVTMLAHSGKTFEFHKDQQEVRFNILYGNYDVIIMQDRQKDYDAENSLRYGMELDQFIQQTRAEKVLYMTWTIEPERHLQQYVADGYDALGRAIGASVAPAGLVWWKYREAYPEEELFFTDGRHASQRGSTLAAYSIYQTLYGYPERLLEERDEKLCSMIAETIEQREA